MLPFCLHREKSRKSNLNFDDKSYLLKSNQNVMFYDVNY